jgi:thioredoxin 1
MFNGTIEEYYNEIKKQNIFVLYIKSSNDEESKELIDLFNTNVKKYQTHKFMILDIEKTKVEDIKVIPTIRLFKEGNQEDEYSGKSKSKLEFFISKNFVQHVTSHSEFENIIKNYNNLIAVDFTATWCGPCKRIAPKFNELNDKYNNVMFVKVDVDDNEETSELCNIRAMPTFQFYKDNQKVFEFSGADENQLENSISKYDQC